jgi:molecular chaperone GrpE
VIIVAPTVDPEGPNGEAAPETQVSSEPSAARPEPPVDPLEQARQEADAEKKAREDLLRELLPVFDNLERAMTSTEKATDVQSVAEGVRMVIRQFTDTLSKLGVERVASVGLPFDPAVHEAIQHLETDEYPPGTVAAEIQGGYRANERLVRPALVVVAKAKS